MKTRRGQLSVKCSARGVPMYSLELWHDGLKKHRLIRGESESLVKLKASLQIEAWDDRWAVVAAREQERSQKTAGRRQQEEKKALAAEQTAEAQRELDELSSLLKASLSVDLVGDVLVLREGAINWKNLKDKTPFPEKEPVPPPLPLEPISLDSKYVPSLSILDKLISSRKKRLISEKKVLFESDHRAWQEQVNAIKQNHERQVAEWSARRDEYIANQDAKRAAYESQNAEAIIEYCDFFLSSSRYPNYLPQEFDLDYDQSSKTIIVDYKIPSPDDLPRFKKINYVVSRDDFEQQFINDSQSSKIYDDVVYQISLRTIHELFQANSASAIDSVVLNGIVTAIDRTTGNLVTSCILSLRANRAEFQKINLAQVDPKACFKSLKGVGSSKLHGLSPVPPIMQLRREDGRFVSAYEVTNTLDGSVNLAAMHWEDFEHLIREVFEKEFSYSGGEVKVTRASRDGGVDAIAFDPDPIRGGKIVIQAKRYTNTVGVGAVRDLYGTLLNEGATKGILVTTSDYGPDSYDFANGKPLVLLSGANLLHMLEKHGHRARIDLQEAKKLAANP